MESSSTIKKIKLTNFLSFGPEGMELELKPLNVIIGANATGKSNLIEAFSFLNSLPNDVYMYFNNRSPIEWMWKGNEVPQIAEISAELDLYEQSIKHKLKFRVLHDKHIFRIEEEEIGFVGTLQENKSTGNIYKFKLGTKPVFKGNKIDESEFYDNSTTPDGLHPNEQSVVLQGQHWQEANELQWLNRTYSDFYIYSDWDFSKDSPARKSQPPHIHGRFLNQEISNLVMVLNDLQSNHPDAFLKIEDDLKSIYPLYKKLVTDFTSAHGYGIVKLYELGLFHPVLATHFSDGLLRFLCLLSILCHPNPPKLICIEEPEIGLHPDAIVKLAKLLREASERTQLIITTHSDILISQLTDTPESVIVCERDEDGTHMNRLEPEKLKSWLKDDFLGDVWLSGGIGGTL